MEVCKIFFPHSRNDCIKCCRVIKRNLFFCNKALRNPIKQVCGMFNHGDVSMLFDLLPKIEL